MIEGRERERGGKETHQKAPVSSHVQMRPSTSSFRSASCSDADERELGLGPSFSMRARSKCRCRRVVESVACGRRRRGWVAAGGKWRGREREEAVEGVRRVWVRWVCEVKKDPKVEVGVR